MDDVVIVGAGPTGLLLAGDLAAAGVTCTVLERHADASRLTRAFAVHARTLELLDARGLADELIATGVTAGRLRLFGGAGVDFSRLPSRFPFVLVTPQYHTERLLERRARALGARIVRGCEVTGVQQDAHGAWVETAQTARRARYVVGADGAHSAVRHSLGLGFPGRALVHSVMLADVRLRVPPRHAITLKATADGFAFIVPFGDGWYRLIAWDRRRQLPDGAPVDFDELCDIARRAFGTDYGVHDPRWTSSFRSDERQVPSYRSGHVFLAGDAAHVHSPAGGLGMNTGLQDAANLSWKLAAAVHGWAPPGVLDSYDAERHRAGRTTLRVSGALLRLMRAGSVPARAGRRALMAAVAGVTPLNRRVAGAISGIDLDYGPAGRRAADVRLPGGTRLYEVLRAGRFVLVGAPLPSAWADRVISVDGGAPMLVRPDGYLAWSPGRRRLHDALRTWLEPAKDVARVSPGAPDRAG